MSKPRRPYGPDQPGRLQATMLKVLAAEMADGARFTRGKRLRADDAVVDLVIGHGAVTALVQGSRPEPYVVTLLARAGRSVPSRRDVTIRCTCPDDDGVGGDACKHGVAALFALADEVSLDLEALARWRQSDTFDDREGDDREGDDREGDDREGDDREGDDREGDDREGQDRAGDDRAGGDAETTVPTPSVDPLVAELAGLLQPPEGERLPALPELTALERAGIPDPLVADVLDDALAHLRVRWD